MKKQILLTAMLGLATCSMFAADLTVTSPSGDATVEGSFPNIMAAAQPDDVILFNLDSDEIAEFTAITVDSKSLTIDGLNKKTGNKIQFTGKNQTLSMKGACTILIKNCIFTGKYEAQALFAQTGVNLRIENCEFIKNYHKSSGGALACSTNVICTIKNSLFKENSAKGDGGCLRIYNNAHITAENCSFIQNHSNGSGGAVYVYSTSKKSEVNLGFTAINCTFVNNYAGNRAGAIYAYSRDTTTPLKNLKVVNSTITANYSTKNLGGGIFMCSNTGCSSEAEIVNSIIAGNTGGLVDGAYFIPTDFGIWYGDKDDAGQMRVRNYNVTCRNNIVGKVYATADDTQLNNVEQNKILDASNIQVADFAKSNIFTELYQLDNTVFPDIESDVVWSPVLTKNAMPVASLKDKSIAIGKGIAKLDGVEIPTTDQLGNARPATPAIGAVEYFDPSGIASTFADGSIRVWNEGNQIFAAGIDTTATLAVFNMIGQQVFEGQIEEGAAVTTGLAEGIYIAKVNNTTVKMIIK